VKTCAADQERFTLKQGETAKPRELAVKHSLNCIGGGSSGGLLTLLS